MISKTIKSLKHLHTIPKILNMTQKHGHRRPVNFIYDELRIGLQRISLINPPAPLTNQFDKASTHRSRNYPSPIKLKGNTKALCKLSSHLRELLQLQDGSYIYTPSLE